METTLCEIVSYIHEYLFYDLPTIKAGKFVVFRTHTKEVSTPQTSYLILILLYHKKFQSQTIFAKFAKNILFLAHV